MIRPDSLTEVGRLFKPHGVKGEISAELDEGLEPGDLRCIILDIEGIMVPFFLKSYRRRGNGWLLTIDGVENEVEAAIYARHDIYALTDELPADFQDSGEGVNLYDLEGYTLVSDGNTIGIITDIDDSTANILLTVSHDGREIMVPFAMELVEDLDPENEIIEMAVPHGIIDLNN